METPSPLFLAAVILAGGQSSRMGEDKALLLYRGLPLLRRIYAIAQELTNAVYVVTPRRDRYGPLLPLDCRWIAEPDPQGSLAGFALALSQVLADWVWLLACDLPYLEINVFAQGIAQLPSVTPSAIAFLPRHAKGWEPMGGFYRRQALGSLSPYLATGRRSFQGWLATQSVQEWQITNPKTLFNCNTPEDWQSLTP